MTRLLSLALVTALAAVAFLPSPLTAEADSSLPSETWTAPLDGPDYPYITVHSGPGTSYEVATTIHGGTNFMIGCWTSGTPVTGPYGTTDIWYSTPNFGSGWVSDSAIWTGSNEPVTARCGTSPQAADAAPVPRYDRVGAAENALTFADTFNFFLSADCTYFVSLSMWDGGGLQPTEEWSNSSPNESLWGSRRIAPGVTKAAINAHEFTQYMGRSGLGVVSEVSWRDNTVNGAQLGDVIAYDWESSQGQSGADGIIDHLAIVTGFTPEGYPLVSQHSPSQVNRFWSWSIAGNNWIGESKPGSRVWLIHIVA